MVEKAGRQRFDLNQRLLILFAQKLDIYKSYSHISTHENAPDAHHANYRPGSGVKGLRPGIPAFA